jgi:hypothetical protein
MNSYNIVGGSEELDTLRDSPEFSALVDAWVEDQFESIQLPPSVREQALNDILRRVPLGAEVLEVFSRVRGQIRDVFPWLSRQKRYDAREKSSLRNYLVDTLEAAIAQGDMFIARDQDTQGIIGMVHACKLEPVGENSPVQGEVVKIGKAFVVPHLRRNGIYRQLRAQVIDHILRKYPNATLLTATKSAAIKHMSTEAGWTEITYGDYMRIHGANEEQVASYEPSMRAQGWCGFTYKPEVKAE